MTSSDGAGGDELSERDAIKDDDASTASIEASIKRADVNHQGTLTSRWSPRAQQKEAEAFPEWETSATEPLQNVDQRARHTYRFRGIFHSDLLFFYFCWIELFACCCYFLRMSN